ncbi:MAG: hypothetical protein INR73_28590 [Williamsia sp.]|nr:hypothetical protein [Williamsia sp.]
MANNQSSSADATVLHPETGLSSGQQVQSYECSYQLDYSLQATLPEGSDYTSCTWKEEAPAAPANTRLTKRLSYAERRLQNYF